MNDQGADQMGNAGNEMTWLQKIGPFFLCESIPRPTNLAAGEVYTGCSILAAPPKQNVSAVKFSFFEDQDNTKQIEITWPAS